MPKQGLFILTVMLIVFSLTLIGGGGNYMFIMSPHLSSNTTLQTTIFWLGTLVALIGLAGFLAGLVGVMGVILVRAAEMKEQQTTDEVLLVENEKETR